MAITGFLVQHEIPTIYCNDTIDVVDVDGYFDDVLPLVVRQIQQHKFDYDANGDIVPVIALPGLQIGQLIRVIIGFEIYYRVVTAVTPNVTIRFPHEAEYHDRIAAIEVENPLPDPDPIADPYWAVGLNDHNLVARLSFFNYPKDAVMWAIGVDGDPPSYPSEYTAGGKPSTYTVSSWDAETWRYYYADVDDNITEILLQGGTSGITLVPVPDPNEPYDQTPNDVTFIEQLGVATETAIESNIVSITGLLAPTAITIADGYYRINGGTYVTTAGTIDENDSVQLRQTSSISNSTETTTTVQLGLREETWDITTVAAATAHGAISIDSGPYEEDEGTDIVFTLDRTGGSAGEVTCRVSTYYVADYHTAQAGLHYTAIVNQLVTFGNGVTSQEVTLTVPDIDSIYNVVGEFQIDWASAAGGATIDTDNDAVLFTINGTGAVTEDSWQQSGSGDHIVKIKAESTYNVITTRSDANGWLSTTYKTLACIWSSKGWAWPPDPGYSSVCPEIMMKINFAVSGIHYLHAKVAGTYDTPNFHVGLDGGEESTTFSYPKNSDWAWHEDSSAYAINIPSTGIHELRLYAADEYTYVTDILLTDNASYDSPTSGDGAGESAWTAGGTTGDHPDNPANPLGPGPITDDKTPDVWTFQPITGVSATPAVYTTATKTLAGINVPTSIVVTGDGTPQYQIDGGNWIGAATTDGLITNTQTFAVRLTSSATNSVTQTATLTIGTVSVNFDVTTIASDAVPLNSISTTINVTGNYTTVENWDFDVANGPCVTIAANVIGTIITNCRMKAGPTSHAITGTAIKDLTISNVEILEAGKRGIYIYQSTGVSVTDCVIENTSSSISIWQTDQNITIEDNYLKNTDRTGGGDQDAGNCVQLAFCRGANFSVQRNIMLNEEGQSTPEDAINLYECRGAASSWITIKDNKIRGGGPSPSGTTIIPTDFDPESAPNTGYVIVEDNVLYNTMQVGIGGGDNTIIRGNKIFNALDNDRDFTNIGISVGWTMCENGYGSPVGLIIESNKVHWWRSPLYGGWYLDPAYLAPCVTTPAGWSTNLFDTPSNPNRSGLSDEEAAGTLWDTDWDIRPDVLSTP